MVWWGGVFVLHGLLHCRFGFFFFFFNNKKASGSGVPLQAHHDVRRAFREVSVLPRDVLSSLGAVFLIEMQKMLAVSRSPCSGMAFFVGVFNDSAERSEHRRGVWCWVSVVPDELLEPVL